MRFILTALLLLLLACSDVHTPHRPKDAPLVRLTDNDARGLDPQMLSDLSSTRIASDLFEGLSRFNASGQPEPGLAKRWSINADGRTWTFHLRDNLRFSDGTPIPAGVFAKAFARIKNTDSGSPHGALFSVIDGVTAPDSRTVLVRLANPFPQLPALLAHPAMAALPFHRIDSVGEKWTADRPLVTSGAYVLTEWQLSQKLLLKANRHWHNGAPVSARIVWRPLDNPNAAMRSVLAGIADIGSDYPPNRHHWLRQNYPALMHNHGYLGTYYFAFNTRKPPFDDRRVRQALSMAVERRWMAKDMVDAGNQPAWGLLPPELRNGTDYQPYWAAWPRSKRLVKARTLLKQAGYDAGKPLRFQIRFNSSAEHRKAAVAMATMWRDLDVQAELLNSEASLHFDSMKRADFQLARSGWIADLPAAENFLSVHRNSAGVQNYSGFNDPRFDKALDTALAESDPKLRTAKMQDAEKILIEEAAILPLYFYTSRALVSPRVTGWVDNAANVHPSRLLGIK